MSRYRLERLIGVGGMAEIYRARVVGIEGFEWVCVVKRILPELASDPTFVSLFLDEARITVKLRHPNIVQVFDLGRRGEELYMVMEFVDGLNLSTILRICREHEIELYPPTVLHVVAGMLSALDYAHHATTLDGDSLDVVHRDVSLSNVLVGRDGGVKLSDFGIARAVTGRTELRQGTFVGKHRYMPPEVAAGGEYTPAGDLFAAGAVLFELATGESLLPGKSFQENVEHLVEHYEAGARVEQVSGALGDLAPIVARAVAADPAARYPSADAFLEELLKVQYRHDLRVSRRKLAKFLGQVMEKVAEEELEASGSSLGEVSFSGAGREVTGLEDLDRAYSRARDRAREEGPSMSASGPEDITEIVPGEGNVVDETPTRDGEPSHSSEDLIREVCLADELYATDSASWEGDPDALETIGAEGMSLDDELEIHGSISDEVGAITLERAAHADRGRHRQTVLFQRGEVLGPLTPGELEATLTGELDPSALLAFDDGQWRPALDYAPAEHRPADVLRRQFNALQIGPTLLNLASGFVRHRVTLWSADQAAQLVVGGGRLWYTALAGVSSPLRQILLEDEQVTADAIPPLPENAPRFERQILELLVQRGVLPRARLEGLSQQVMRSTLALLYQWPAGEFIVDEWGFPAADEVWEKPMELLPGLAAVSRSSPHAAVVVQLVREGQIKQIQVRANAIEKLPELPLAPQEAALLRRIGSWKPLGEVLYLDGDGQVDRVGRAVFLLIQLGLVTVF